MKCFAVKINGEHLCTAGVDGIQVLSAGVTSVHRVALSTPEEEGPYDIHLEIGGLYSPSEGTIAYPLWVQQRKLKVGDSITITIVEEPNPDPPVSERREVESTPDSHT